MSFLDTTTTVKEGNITTDLYSKPTEKHQYLSPSSCHPKHCFKSIPFSQAIRVKRICTTAETTKQRLGDLRHHLKRRRYNDRILLKQCLGWQLLGERYWCLSVGLEYTSVVMLPSLTVVVVSRKDILVFDTSCVNLTNKSLYIYS
jgi:hypothetical protein